MVTTISGGDFEAVRREFLPPALELGKLLLHLTKHPPLVCIRSTD
jgi:hypothetical protein